VKIIGKGLTVLGDADVGREPLAAGIKLYKVGLLKNCVTYLTDEVQGCHNVSVCDLIYLASDYIESCYAVGLKLYPKTKVFPLTVQSFGPSVRGDESR
jgi:hypothetical protein